MRMSVPQLARLTNSFSKKWENARRDGEPTFRYRIRALQMSSSARM